jgi:hypothetical protein
MRTTRLARLGGVAAVAALAVTGWLAPAWGHATPHAKVAADGMSMSPAAANLARRPARRRTPGHRQVRHQPGAGQSRWLLHHHQDDA